jgi:hypothetical protein
MEQNLTERNGVNVSSGMEVFECVLDAAQVFVKLASPSRRRLRFTIRRLGPRRSLGWAANGYAHQEARVSHARSLATRDCTSLTPSHNGQQFCPEIRSLVRS